jgi:hypothetical protein
MNKSHCSEAGNNRSKRGKLRVPGELSYVFSEGKNSEPSYANGIKKIAEESGFIAKGSLIIDDSVNGCQGLLLVKVVEAKVSECQRNLLKKYGNQRITDVWIFFDYDGNDKEYWPAFVEIDRLNKSESKKGPKKRILWHACWSSYCFELWLLLHFQLVEQSFKEKDLEDKLSSLLVSNGFPEGYSKSDVDIFEKIYSPERSKNAIKRAILLNKNISVHGRSHGNPSTGVEEFAKLYLHNVLKGLR